jgi:hypothetical protein
LYGRISTAESYKIVIYHRKLPMYLLHNAPEFWVTIQNLRKIFSLPKSGHHIIGTKLEISKLNSLLHLNLGVSYLILL